MNDVVLATHADGVARFYFRTTEGALNQTGQLVAPTVDPTLLATLAADLSDALGWNPAPPKPKAVKAPATAEIDKPKPKAKSASSYRNRPRAGRDEMARRQQEAIDYMAEHGGEATAPGLGRAMHADLPAPVADAYARKTVSLLEKAGKVVRVGMPPGKADVYRLTTEFTEYRQPEHVANGVQPDIVTP